MKENKIDQALSALGFALKEQKEQNPLNNISSLIDKIPDRALSGNHINGGRIANFSSGGIVDNATQEEIVISNNLVKVKTLKVDKVIDNFLVEGNAQITGTMRVDTLEVNNLRAEIDIGNNNPIRYIEQIDGKGFNWIGDGYTKQLVYQSHPNRIFSSENIDVARDKHFSVNGIKVLDDKEIGSSITKSNLKEVGTLRGLIVEGSVNFNQYMFYDGNTDRLGLGTDQPNAALSIAEDGIEVAVGTKDFTKGYIGTFTSHDLQFVTDDTARLSINANGHILLGNKSTSPVQVSVHGKLAIKVNMPDPEVDLHVAGPIKFSGKLQKYDNQIPTAGDHNEGDIVWNNHPSVGGYVGWICCKSGNPGTWEPFGKIGNS